MIRDRPEDARHDTPRQRHLHCDISGAFDNDRFRNKCGVRFLEDGRSLFHLVLINGVEVGHGRRPRDPRPSKGVASLPYPAGYRGNGRSRGVPSRHSGLSGRAASGFWVAGTSRWPRLSWPVVLFSDESSFDVRRSPLEWIVTYACTQASCLARPAACTEAFAAVEGPLASAAAVLHRATSLGAVQIQRTCEE
jgi:hypothetical protein